MLKAPVHSAFPLSFCEQLKFQFIFPFPCISERIYFVPNSLKIHNYTNILKNDLFLFLLLIVINETNLFLVMFVSFHLCLTVILNHSPIIGGGGGGLYFYISDDLNCTPIHLGINGCGVVLIMFNSLFSALALVKIASNIFSHPF